MVFMKTFIWQTLQATALTGLLAGTVWMHAAGGPAGSTLRPWQIVTSPNTGQALNQLVGVAALSPHNIWAVGGSSNSFGLIEHFDGASWSIVPSPVVPDATGGFLQAVAGASPNDVWAVGTFSVAPLGTPSRTLIEHFDGTSWQVMASPNPSAASRAFLNSVVALSPNNVWAVGAFGLGASAPAGPSTQTLIEHFDGTSWSIVPSPNSGLDENLLNGVSAVSPNDIWAVGRIGFFPVADRSEERTLVVHFDGVQWSVVPSANVTPGSNNLGAVAAASPRNVWAVGFQTTADDVARTLIEHFDGTNWSVIPSPNASASDNSLIGVAIASPNNIWAVGNSLNATAGATETLIEHFDGSNWAIVPSPNASAVDNRLVSVAALSAQNVWAVGFTFKSSVQGTTTQTLIEQQAP